MKRKFTIVIDVIDNEAPNGTNEECTKAMKAYMIDALGDLNFDVKDIQVSCE